MTSDSDASVLAPQSAGAAPFRATGRMKSHDELIALAEQIGQAAEREVAEAERECCFSLRLRDLVHQAEFHKVLRPARYGGFAKGGRTFSEIVRTVARYNASAAWLVYFTILHEQWVAYLDPKGREEIYASDRFCADMFFPIGKVEYVEGGVKLSGQWNWGSGVLWDDWIGLGAIVEVPGVAGGMQPCLVVVKTQEIEIVRNWNPLGLRGTGSHGVKADSVFVPWHRVVPLLYVKNFNQPLGGDWTTDTPIYRIPFMPMFAVGFGAIAVGVAQRVARDVKQRLRERQRVLYGVKEWESPIAQRNLGELLTQLASIEALHERYVQQLEDWDAANTPQVPEGERNHTNAWRSYVCREASLLALRGLEMLGGAAAYTGDPIEIAARDLLMVRIHVGQIYDDNMLAYGRTEYGLSGHPLL